MECFSRAAFLPSSFIFYLDCARLSASARCHASAASGGGFCAFADISLAIKLLREHRGEPTKAIIVDLDAHQGNGHERDFMDDPNTFIVDAFDPNIYPWDKEARKGISLAIELDPEMGDEEYLRKISSALRLAGEKFRPEIVVYNAGTDIMIGDPLGGLKISHEGIIKRDELVFRWALENRVPIAMVLSGGYQKSNAPVIARSIENLLANVLPRGG